MQKITKKPKTATCRIIIRTFADKKEKRHDLSRDHHLPVQ